MREIVIILPLSIIITIFLIIGITTTAVSGTSRTSSTSSNDNNSNHLILESWRKTNKRASFRFCKAASFMQHRPIVRAWVGGS